MTAAIIFLIVTNHFKHNCMYKLSNTYNYEDKAVVAIYMYGLKDFLAISKQYSPL